MGKRKNKLIAVLLAASMIGSLMTGCGNEQNEKPAASSSATTSSSAEKEQPASSETPASSSEEVKEVLEPVELVVWLNQGTGTDDAIVEKAFNELDVMKELNLTVDFVTIPTGDKWDQKLDLALAAQEKIDVVLGDYGANARKRMEQGAYADITELLNTKYTEFRNSIPEVLLSGSEVNGALYGVQSIKEPSSYRMFFIQKSVVDKYNLDLSNRDVWNLTDILEKLKADGRATFMLKYSEYGNLRNMAFNEEFIKINRDFCSVTYEDPKTIVNPYESDMWKKLSLQSKEWYDKGLIPQDVLTKENYTAEMNDENLYGLLNKQGDVLSLYRQEQTTGFDLEEIEMTSHASAWGSNGYYACVNAKCENIERALSFIELFYLNPEVKNLITYGVEGLHYDLVDGYVNFDKYPDHATAWQTANTRTGAVTLCYPLEGFPEEGYTLYAEDAKTMRMSPLAGFTVSTKNVENEIAACKAVEIEYVNMLMTGVTEDVEATIAEMNKKMYDNGLQKIIDDFQKQLDAWWAAK